MFSGLLQWGRQAGGRAGGGAAWLDLLHITTVWRRPAGSVVLAAAAGQCSERSDGSGAERGGDTFHTLTVLSGCGEFCIPTWRPGPLTVLGGFARP